MGIAGHWKLSDTSVEVEFITQRLQKYCALYRELYHVPHSCEETGGCRLAIIALMQNKPLVKWAPDTCVRGILI